MESGCVNLNASYNGLRGCACRLRAGYKRFPCAGKNIDNAHRHKIPIRRSAYEYEETDDSDRGKESEVAFGLYFEWVLEDRDRFDEKSRKNRGLFVEPPKRL